MSRLHERKRFEMPASRYASILKQWPLVACLCSLAGCGEPDDAVESGAARPAERAPSAEEGPGDTTTAVTFNEHIAPLVYRHCTPCHRPGQVAPFSLMTYQDLESRATQIADVTESRYMPPWKPEPGHGEFVGSRRLESSQVSLFRKWVAAGLLEGNADDLPPQPVYRDGWLLGKPDLVVRMSEPFTLPASGEDQFRTFVLPIPTDQVWYVRGVECRPSNARVVHHADILIDPTSHSRELDALDPLPGFEGMRPVESASVGFLTGWAPGGTPLLYPKDHTWRLDPASDLLLTLHMLPSGKPEQVDFSLGFHFSEEAPQRSPYIIRLASTTIDIPAGVSDYAVEDSYVLPVDVEVVGIRPHAHYLGKTIDASATLPDGKTVPLLRILDWDFNWQDDYRYEHPIVLPKGSRIAMRCSYDNSEGNIRNPHSPPQRVTWGANSNDEMALVLLQVFPSNEEDYHTLAFDLQKKGLNDKIRGYETSLHDHQEDLGAHSSLNYYYGISREKQQIATRLEEATRATPDDPHLGYCLAAVHSLLGNEPRAVQQYQEVLRHAPDYHLARLYLAKSLIAIHRFDEAVAELDRVVKVHPDYYDVHALRGVALKGAKQVDEAVESFLQAISIQPNDFTSQFELGNIHAQKKRWADAERWLQGALAADPTHALAMVNLGIALQNQDKAGEAIDLLQKALAIDPENWLAHANLASCLQTSSRIDEALFHYQEAIRIRPNVWPVRMRLGSLWMSVNQPQKAVEQFLAVTKGDATSARAHLQAAVGFKTLGKIDDALIHYRKANGLRPNWLPAATGLAWILSTHPDNQIRDPATAVTLVESFTGGNNPHPVTLDTLAAAYAALNRFDLAVATADRAYKVAKAANLAVSERIAERAALYRQQLPYLEEKTPSQ